MSISEAIRLTPDYKTDSKLIPEELGRPELGGGDEPLGAGPVGKGEFGAERLAENPGPSDTAALPSSASCAPAAELYEDEDKWCTAREAFLRPMVVKSSACCKM